MATERQVQQVAEKHGLKLQSWQILEGGTSNNQCIMIETQSDRWVLRSNAPSIPGVNRKREARVLDLVSKAELAPEVLTNKPDSDYLIYRYVPGVSWSSEGRVSRLSQESLALWFKRLHALDHRIEAVNPMDCIKRYASQLKPQDPTLAQWYLNREAQLRHDLGHCGIDLTTRALCHMDANPANIFGTQHILLIDWEFAGASHPWLDLTLFLSQHQADIAHFMPFLDAYFDGRFNQFLNSLEVLEPVGNLLIQSWMSLQ